MAFKKTAEGRVFFQNLEELEKENNTPKPAPRKQAPKARSMLRTSPSQTGGAANQSQTQFQIIALLKTLNAKLQNTQAERDTMQKQLDRYDDVVSRLEEKATRTHDAYEQLNKSVKAKDTEMLAQSRRAEQIAQEAFGELDEARRLIMDLEDKVELSEKEMKRHVASRQKIETDIAARHAEFEKFQQTLADHSLTSKNLTKRLNKAEELHETLDVQVTTTISKQETLDRKLEKSTQERTRMLRKVDRIEEAVIQTRDAMNAKAMVLLTDQDSAGGTVIPASLEDMDEDAIQALLRAQATAAQKSEEDQFLPWWKKPLHVNPFSAVSFVVIAILAGWLVSETQKPVMSDMEELQIFSNYKTSRSEIENNTETGSTTNAGTMLSDISKVGLEHASKVKMTAEALMSKIRGDEAADSAEETIKIASTQTTPPTTLTEQSATTPAPDQTLQQTGKAINDDIGTLDINDEAALLRALEADPQKLAEQLNNLEPSSIPTTSTEQTSVQTQATTTPQTSSSLNDVPSAFASNPDQYDKADPNLPEAVKSIEEKALNGTSDAQHDLAAIYTAGHGGVQQDYKRAAYWFEKSARGGIANSAYNLGVLYHQGLGVKSNLPMAINWYKAAANMGHPEAQYNLGIAHIEGVGVEYNPITATAYFEQAANNNVVEAAYNLGLIHENGLLGEAKPDEAIMWYKMSADQGSPEAREALGQLAKGLGIKIDDINRLADSMRASRK